MHTYIIEETLLPFDSAQALRQAVDRGSLVYLEVIHVSRNQAHHIPTNLPYDQPHRCKAVWAILVGNMGGENLGHFSHYLAILWHPSHLL